MKRVRQMKLVTVAGTLVALSVSAGLDGAAAEPLQQRIAHNDPARYKLLRRVHRGAGEMKFCELLDSSALKTNFLFLHSGVILPRGGIGHHFHHEMEEMYLVVDGEAEFTINGRTSRLKAPVVVPCKMGQSHAIYNPTDQPLRWLNFAVSLKKGKADSFDLDDDRVGVPIDPKPVFVHARLDRALLSRVHHDDGGKGAVQYRRVLQPEIFRTPWAYVDHVVIRPGASTGKRTCADFEELWYVLSGTGRVRVDGQQATIKQGDAVPIRLDEAQSFSNDSAADFELLVVGIAREKHRSRP